MNHGLPHNISDIIAYELYTDGESVESILENSPPTENNEISDREYYWGLLYEVPVVTEHGELGFREKYYMMCEPFDVLLPERNYNMKLITGEFFIKHNRYSVSTLNPNYKRGKSISISDLQTKPLSQDIINKYKTDYPALNYINLDNSGIFWFYKDELVGYVIVDNTYKRINYSWISVIEVNPKYRGHYIATQILDYAIKEFDAEAITISKYNAIMLHMCIKHGFIHHPITNYLDRCEKLYFMYLNYSNIPRINYIEFDRYELYFESTIYTLGYSYKYPYSLSIYNINDGFNDNTGILLMGKTSLLHEDSISNIQDIFNKYDITKSLEKYDDEVILESFDIYFKPKDIYEPLNDLENEIISDYMNHIQYLSINEDDNLRKEFYTIITSKFEYLTDYTLPFNKLETESCFVLRKKLCQSITYKLIELYKRNLKTLIKASELSTESSHINMIVNDILNTYTLDDLDFSNNSLSLNKYNMGELYLSDHLFKILYNLKDDKLVSDRDKNELIYFLKQSMTYANEYNIVIVGYGYSLGQYFNNKQASEFHISSFRINDSEYNDMYDILNHIVQNGQTKIAIINCNHNPTKLNSTIFRISRQYSDVNIVSIGIMGIYIESSDDIIFVDIPNDTDEEISMVFRSYPFRAFEERKLYKPYDIYYYKDIIVRLYLITRYTVINNILDYEMIPNNIKLIDIINEKIVDYNISYDNIVDTIKSVFIGTMRTLYGIFRGINEVDSSFFRCNFTLSDRKISEDSEVFFKDYIETIYDDRHK